MNTEYPTSTLLPACVSSITVCEPLPISSDSQCTQTMNILLFMPIYFMLLWMGTMLTVGCLNCIFQHKKESIATEYEEPTLIELE